MAVFRFSPVQDKQKLLKAFEYIHLQSFRLCKQNLGHILPVAGNIGFFCHYQDEFKILTKIREEMTDRNRSWNRKYFKLHIPIIFPAINGVPRTTYTYLYIREPNVDTPNVGDVDFYLEPEKYNKLKRDVITGKFKKGVRMFERPDLDLIRLYDPHIDVSAFIGSYNLEAIATTNPAS